MPIAPERYRHRLKTVLAKKPDEVHLGAALLKESFSGRWRRVRPRYKVGKVFVSF